MFKERRVLHDKKEVILDIRWTKTDKYIPATVNLRSSRSDSIFLHIDFRYSDNQIVLNRRENDWWWEENAIPFAMLSGDKVTLSVSNTYLKVTSPLSIQFFRISEYPFDECDILEFIGELDVLSINGKSIEEHEREVRDAYEFEKDDPWTLFDELAYLIGENPHEQHKLISETLEKIVQSKNISNLSAIMLADRLSNANLHKEAQNLLAQITPTDEFETRLIDIKDRLFAARTRDPHESARSSDEKQQPVNFENSLIQLDELERQIQNGNFQQALEVASSGISRLDENFFHYNQKFCKLATIAALHAPEEIDRKFSSLEAIISQNVLSQPDISRALMWKYYYLRDEIELAKTVNKFISSLEELAPLKSGETIFERPEPKPLKIEDSNEIICISVIRNEMQRLPCFYNHYKNLGVDKFIFVDNGSTDGSIEFLSELEDVFVFRTSESYSESRFGVKWHNQLAAEYCTGNWVLTVDADELLVVEDGLNLKDLSIRMEAEGADALLSPMIDMYSERPLSQVDFKPGDSMVEKFPLFDGEGYQWHRILESPSYAFSGGVRPRVFGFNRWSNRSQLAQQKVPFVYWKPTTRYFSSTHELTPVSVSKVSSALLHYKFMPDFHERAAEEVERKEHFNDASEYMVYVQRQLNLGDLSFQYPGTREFKGMESLLDICSHS